jgi:hypothetical protein
MGVLPTIDRKPRSSSLVFRISTENAGGGKSRLSLGSSGSLWCVGKQTSSR